MTQKTLSFFICIYALLVSVYCIDKLTCETRSNGIQTFRILQFTDTHFGESSTKDQQSSTSFTNLVSYESPNLITISGDFISGYAYNGTKGWFKDTFNYGISSIINSNIPWAYTLGNHDDQADWNRTQIINYAMSLNNSFTNKGPINIGGVSNYVVTVYDIDNNPVANIWYLDSLDDNCYDVSGWGCVEFSTVEWYKNKSIELENEFGKKLPGIMYIHIPLPELLFVYNNGVNNVGMQQDSGICCWSLNTGLFSVMEQRQDIVSVWHGHDHDNDFYGLWNDIYIGYGRKTGYGGYGPPTDMERGARVLEFVCNKTSTKKTFVWQTWIRENDGTKIETQPNLKSGDWKQWKQCCGATYITNRNLNLSRFYNDSHKHTY